MIRIAYVSNNAMFFATHRLALAEHALAKGYDVTLFIGQAGSPSIEPWAEAKIIAAGVPVIRLPFQTSGLNPFSEMWGLLQLHAALKRFSPQIIHSASPKGNLYAGLAGLRIGAAHVFAISGMGFLFTSSALGQSLKQKTLGSLYSKLIKSAFARPRKRLIVQNRDDFEALANTHFLDREEIVLLSGSGVKLGSTPDRSKKINVVLFPARLLWDKGAAEFAEMARSLKARYSDWRFVMAGAIDYDNPRAVPAATLETWRDEGIEIPGFKTDMSELYAQASIVCLPSYREGFPKALMEGSAAGAAIVTTDAIGCRDAVRPAQTEGITAPTGYLVPLGDAQALSAAVEHLILHPRERQMLGEAARQYAESNFGIEQLTRAIFELYDVLLETSKPAVK
jgi:glycosyltransferase involved in cell wall biosynthesis